MNTADIAVIGQVRYTFSPEALASRDLIVPHAFMKRYTPMNYQVIQANATKAITHETLGSQVDLTFLDPPFNQNKQYTLHKDSLPDENSWQMGRVLELLF